ncbi:MAG TPA: hypothetical protein VKB76_09165 [Ktedonobacterales bacterium]|nr:hypothetical protein [Ktedonobacterales bacterium]
MSDHTYTVDWDGRAGDATDLKVYDLVAQAGGKVIGSGTFIASDPPHRDLDFTVPQEAAGDLCLALLDIGLKAKRRKDGMH